MLSSRRKMPFLVRLFLAFGIALEMFSSAIMGGQVTMMQAFGTHYAVLEYYGITSLVAGLVGTGLGYLLIIQAILMFVYPKPVKPRTAKPQRTPEQKKRRRSSILRLFLVLVGIGNIYAYVHGGSGTITLPVAGVSFGFATFMDKIFHMAVTGISTLRNLKAFGR